MNKTESLQELSIKINNAVKQSKELYDDGIIQIQEALKSEKEAGLLLIEVKSALPHGQFIDWIEVNCCFKERYARYLMSVARNWEKVTEGWDSLQTKTATCCRFDSPLPSLRTAIALASADDKKDKPLEQPVIERYKVADPKSDCFGEIVEVVETLHQGDVVVCRTPKGEFPFFRKELVAEDARIEIIDAEVVSTVTEELADQLREAIAVVIEYLPESILNTILASALQIGLEHLPESAKTKASQLVSRTRQNKALRSA